MNSRVLIFACPRRPYLVMIAQHPALVAGLCLAALCLPSTHGMNRALDEAKPAWMNEVTLSRPGRYSEVPACELSYKLSWNGLVKAGEAKVTLGKRNPNSPVNLIGTGEGRSAGLAKRLWYYKNTFKSEVDARSLRPVRFESMETEKKERTITRARLDGGQVSRVEEQGW